MLGCATLIYLMCKISMVLGNIGLGLDIVPNAVNIDCHSLILLKIFCYFASQRISLLYPTSPTTIVQVTLFYWN